MCKRVCFPGKISDTFNMFLIVSTFGVIFLIGIVQPLDGDTWWHLRAGEVTFEQHGPLAVDLFSYTKFGEPWTSNSWLTDLWLYLTYKLAGFTGLSAWIAILTVVTLALTYQMMEGPAIYKCLLILIASILLLPYLKARPQMVSLALFALTACILKKTWLNKQKTILLLLPIFTVWANLHAGFIIGLVYILLFLVGVTILKYWNGDTYSDAESDHRKRLIIIFGFCLAAVMINPFGLNVWTNIYNTLRVDSLNTMIVEWASLDFHDIHQQVYLWMILVVMAVLGLSPRRIEWYDLPLLIFFTAVGFIWRRNTAFLVVIALVTVSKYLWPLITGLCHSTNHLWAGKLLHKIDEMLIILDESSPRLLNVFMLFLILAVYAGGMVKLSLLTRPSMIEKLESRQFPLAARQWIETNKPNGKMLNSYNWGGYFDWYLRDYPVFLDGRTDLFGDEIINQWLDVMNATGDWEAILERWQINLIVIEPGWRIVDLLPFHGWKVFYQDDQSVIFGRIPQDKSIN